MRYEDAHRKDVVCAILSRREGNEDHFLIGRRSGTSVLDGLYEFPGGKVNRGVSLGIALKRGIREEIGAEVEVKGFFMHPFTFDYTEEEDGIEGYISCTPCFAPFGLIARTKRKGWGAKYPILGYRRFVRSIRNVTSRYPNREEDPDGFL
jgi:8-oxo-dGTP pyrophosphatase MutT (NUDIX family)